MDPNLTKYDICRNASFAESSYCYKNDTSLDDEEYLSVLMVQRIVSIVVPILFGLIVLIGLFGNSLVVIVVAANQQMRSTTNLLIINLAVADLLFIVFCVPSTALDYMLPNWPMGELWCKMVQYLISVTAYASVYTLVLMSLDRYLAVVHPISSMSVRTERNALVAISLTWLVILLANVPVFMSHGIREFTYRNNTQKACIFMENHGWNSPAFRISFFLTSYVVPLVLIGGLYLLMLLSLWRGVAPGGHVSAESRRGKRRVTRMVVVVVAIFAVCWLPIQVILVLKSMELYPLDSAALVMLQVVSQVLAYMNSCVNPILYAFLSDNFRKAFRKVVYCRPWERVCGGGAAAAQANGRLNGNEKTTVTKTTRTDGPNDFL